MIVSRRFALVFACSLVGIVGAQIYGQGASVAHSRGEVYNRNPAQPVNRVQQYSSISSRSNVEDDQSRQFPNQYVQGAYAFTQQQVNYQQPQQQVNYQQSPPQNGYQQPQQRPPAPVPFASPPSQNTYYNNQRAPVQRPQAPQQNYQRPNQTPRPQALDSRYMSDDASAYETLTTRRTPAVPRPTTNLPPPPALDTRFDNFTTRRIMWDGELSKNTEEFSLKLFAYLESLYPEESIMISPFSVHSLLVLIAEGAGGNTFTELENVLGLKSKQRARDFHQYITTALKKSSSDVTISSFGAMIGDSNRPIGREYEDIVEGVFDVEYIPVNFRDVEKTLKDVNDQVSQKTNGQIKQALTRDEIYKAQLILLSGVYFQGSWKNVFNASSTKLSPFFDYKQERQTGTVNMMFQRGTFAYTAIQDIGAYILELPYGPTKKSDNRNSGSSNSDPANEVFEDRVSMIIVLPKKGQELFTTIDLVNKYGMERLFKELKKVKEEYEDDEVEVYLPRFETTTSLNLVEALMNMEINDLFDQSKAELSKINTNYFVSSILHKTKIRVDERGTEAAAVTTSIFQNKATPPVLTANRPFLYFIVDKASRLVLFAGAYKKPVVF